MQLAFLFGAKFTTRNALGETPVDILRKVELYPGQSQMERDNDILFAEGLADRPKIHADSAIIEMAKDPIEFLRKSGVFFADVAKLTKYAFCDREHKITPKMLFAEALAGLQAHGGDINARAYQREDTALVLLGKGYSAKLLGDYARPGPALFPASPEEAAVSVVLARELLTAGADPTLTCDGMTARQFFMEGPDKKKNLDLSGRIRKHYESNADFGFFEQLEAAEKSWGRPSGVQPTQSVPTGATKNPKPR